MALGITIRLHSAHKPRQSLTGLHCLWWDNADVYDLYTPQGRTNSATTDASGDLILDLSAVTTLIVGDTGYLVVRKPDATNHQDSLVFQGNVIISTVTGGTALAYGFPLVTEASEFLLSELSEILLDERA